MKKANKPRLNDRITAERVKVIDSSGDMLGEYDIKDALELAYDESMDLIEINPDSRPPICKIIDYGKHQYLMQKKKQEAKRKQKSVTMKELYVHLAIAQHDYNVRLKQLISFIKEGFKVKIGVKFRGRERAHQDKGLDLLNKFYTDIGEENVKLEVPPKLEGNNAIVVFAPISSK